MSTLGIGAYSQISTNMKLPYLERSSEGLEDAKELVRLHCHRVFAVELDTVLVGGIHVQHGRLSLGKRALRSLHERLHDLVEPVVRAGLVPVEVVSVQLRLDLLELRLDVGKVGLQLGQ